MRADLRAALPGILVAVLVAVPFFGKTFTIDDTVFLREAAHALHDPLHPTAFDYVWFSSPERLSETITSGPVMAYLLVPVVAAGAPEWLAHMESLILLLLGIVGTAACARRLGCGPRGCWLAATLLACAPATLAMATTNMPDVPAMSAGVWAIERYLGWIDRRSVRQGVLAALLFALAMGLRAHTVGLLLVALVAARSGAGAGAATSPRSGRSGAWSAAWPLALALLLTAALLLVTADPQGPRLGIAAAIGKYFYPQGIARNATAFGVHWVACLPFAWAWMVCARRPARLAAGVAFLVLFAGAAAYRGHGARPESWFTLALAALGLATTFSVVVAAWVERDGVQLTLGLWLLVALPIIVYVHLPAKYLLVSAPAAAILVARRSADADWGRGRIAVLAAVAAAGIVLGVLINRADARFGESARRMARAQVRPAVAAGRRVWFAGHWGFQWYMEEAGARCLSTETRTQMAAGDLLVVDRLQYRWLQVEPGRPFGRLLAVEADADPGGRIMQDGAGFYDNSMGVWPWVWGRSAAARVELWSLD